MNPTMPRQSVVLVHALPDGSSHLDWMIESLLGAERLITFRCPIGTEIGRAGRFLAERLADHRRHYLEYEGGVSGGRGEVRRLCRFHVEVVEAGEMSVRLILKSWQAAGQTIEWQGRKMEGADKSSERVAWEFVGAVC